MDLRLIQARTHPQGALEIIYAGAQDDDVCLVQDDAGLAVEVDGICERFGREVGLDLLDPLGNVRAAWRAGEGDTGLRAGLDLQPGSGGETYRVEAASASREPAVVRHADPFTGGPTPVQPSTRYRLELEACAAGSQADLMLLISDRQGTLLDTVRRRLPADEAGLQRIGVDFLTAPGAARLEITVVRQPGGQGWRLLLGRPSLGAVAAGARSGWDWTRLGRPALREAASLRAEDGVVRLRAPLPEHLLDGEEHRLLVRVLGYAGSLEIPFAKFKHAPIAALSKAGLERASVVRLAGRPAQRDLARLDLQFVIDGRASERHRIKPREGKFDARLPIPAEYLDGRPHQVEVRDAASQAVLFSVNRRTAAFHTRWPVLQGHAQPPLSPESSPARTQHLRALSVWAERARTGGSLPDLPHLQQELLGGPRVRPSYSALAVPAPASPKASVIVPAHNKFEVTYLCLTALLFAPVEASFEVVLVDDGSTDETRRIEQTVAGLRVVRHELAQGFVAACNRGAEAARGEYLVFLNNDTEVTEGWLDELLAAFESDGRAGLAGAKLIYPDGRLQEAGGIVWGTGDPWNAGRGAEPDEPAWRYPREADYLSGAAVMTPAAVWQELGGFSAEFAPAYFEDTDYAMKVRASGRRVVYVPTAEVFHYEGQTAGTDKTEGAKRFQEINRPKFKRKWRDLYAGRRQVGDRPDLEKDRDVLLRTLVLVTKLSPQDAELVELVSGIRELGGKPTVLPLDLRRRTAADGLERRGAEVLSAPFVRDLPGFFAKAAADYDAIILLEPELEATVRALLGPLAPRLVVARPTSATAADTVAWLRETLASVDVFGHAAQEREPA